MQYKQQSMKLCNGSTPDGFATPYEIGRSCGLTTRSVTAAIQRLGIPLLRIGGRGKRGVDVIDVDDWFLKWMPDEVPGTLDGDEPAAYEPHRGMTTCPICGDDWESPDRLRKRFCDQCRKRVRKNVAPDAWIGTGADWDVVITRAERGIEVEA